MVGSPRRYSLAPQDDHRERPADGDQPFIRLPKRSAVPSQAGLPVQIRPI